MQGLFFNLIYDKKAYFMNKTHSTATFPVHVSVKNKCENIDATCLLGQFIEQASETFDLTLKEPLSGNKWDAEAVFAVPFAEREHIRIRFNIFASEMDYKYGQGLYFHMESAF